MNEEPNHPRNKTMIHNSIKQPVQRNKLPESNLKYWNSLQPTNLKISTRSSESKSQQPQKQPLTPPQRPIGIGFGDVITLSEEFRSRRRRAVVGDRRRRSFFGWGGRKKADGLCEFNVQIGSRL